VQLPPRGRRRADLLVVAVFALGLALSLLLALRSQVGGDQLNLLARGWLLVERGEWVPYGNPSSSGGAVPGGVTALIVGGPLALWPHHRAAVLGMLLTQVVGFLLLDRWLREALGHRERLLFAVVYWLNPWRLVLSGFLWNPGYLLLVGAAHVWTLWRQRAAPRLGLSVAHALALGIGFQIHPSVVLLGMVSLLALFTRHFRPSWTGLALGSVLAALPLLPWLLAIGGEPAMLPTSKGFLGRGLVLVFPLLRGILYWLRHVSLHLSGTESQLDFAPSLGALGRMLSGLGVLLTQVVGAPSLALPLLANLRLWRPLFLGRWRAWRPLVLPGRGRRQWVRSYVRLCFVAALLVYALAPTTVMWWQGVSLLHAAVLPLALWAGALARIVPRRVSLAARAWGGCAVALALLLAFGGPRHHCGADDIVIPLRHDHPMLHELGIHRSCPVPVQRGGWWPDVLPEPPSGRRPPAPVRKVPATGAGALPGAA
jgi:hypothetical protein